MHLAHLGPVLRSAAFQAVERRVETCARVTRRQQVSRVERLSEGIVQRCPRHVQIGHPANPLFGDCGKVYPYGEHVDIGGHAGSADGLSAAKIGLRRADRLFRRLRVSPARTTSL